MIHLRFLFLIPLFITTAAHAAQSLHVQKVDTVENAIYITGAGADKLQIHQKLYVRSDEGKPVEITVIYPMMSFAKCHLASGLALSVLKHIIAGQSVTTDPFIDESENNSELIIWTYSKGFESMTTTVIPSHPNTKIRMEFFPQSDFFNQVNKKILSGEKPDILLIESGMYGRFLESDITLSDLSLFGANKILNRQYRFLRDSAVRPDGSIPGIYLDACPSLFWYRKDVAREILGTDDPEAVQSMVSDWTAAYATARKIQQKNKSYHLLDSAQAIAYHYISYPMTPLMTGSKPNYGELIHSFISLIKEGGDIDAFAGIRYWTDERRDSIRKGNRSVFYWMPTWDYYNFVNNGVIKSSEWAAIPGPERKAWGGTLLSILNTCRIKRTAWDFIAYTCNDETSFRKEYLRSDTTSATHPLITGFPSNRTFVESFKNEVFAADTDGKNTWTTFSSFADVIPARAFSKHDQEIMDIVNGMIPPDGKITVSADELYNAIDARLRKQLPDIK